MPRFQQVIESGAFAGLKEVMSSSLLTVEGRPGEPPPVNDVMRAAFRILGSWARLPPEAGAPEGEKCALEPPPIASANTLCEARRAMDTLLHEGKGVEALVLADPVIGAVLDYIVGRPPSSSTPHYEVAGVLAGMCQQNRACQLTDTLDLVIALVAFLETPDGAGALDRAIAMVRDPAVAPYFNNDGKQFGDEAGIVGLVEVLLTMVKGMEDPAVLDDLPLDALPEDLHPAVRGALADLKLLLDPNRVPNVLAPMKKVVTCYTTQDPRSEAVRMVYRLGFTQDLPEFGIYSLVDTLDGVRKQDPRGSLLFVARKLLEDLRKDELAADAAAQVCATLLSNDSSGGGISNAELVLPGLATAFDAQVMPELLCAVDTLVYGCSGGEQPACR